MMREPLIFSIGGSVIAPDGPDERFIRRFRSFAAKLARTRRVVLMCGGGSTSRRYIAAARRLGVSSADALHEVGIRATVLNAELMRATLGVREPVVTRFSGLRRSRARIIIAAGDKPGHTTDFGAVAIARELGSRTIINVTNVPGVYTADPKKDRRATLIPELSWVRYRRMFPKTSVPGIHAPFDPVASALAQRIGCSVIIISSDLPNIGKAIAGKPFIGTVIGPA
jgi:uridylate kinase